MGKKQARESYGGKRVTARGKRFLESKAPKLREDAKVALLFKGTKTSEASTTALKMLQLLKLPDAKALNRRRDDIKVFEDAANVERLCSRYDAGFFGIASHSKKRPDNIILGRVYDDAVLDMFEFGVLPSKGKAPGKLVGSKPCVVFVGEDWAADEKWKRLKNYFADFFRGPDVDKVNLAGLDTVLVIATAGGRIHISPCRLDLRKSGSSIPNVKLAPLGSDLILEPRRDHLPSLDLWKAALRQPKAMKGPKKIKNVSKTDLGETLGTIHLGNQNLNNLQTRKVKALKHKSKPAPLSSGD